MGGRAQRNARTRRRRRQRWRYGERPQGFEDWIEWSIWWVVLPLAAVLSLPFAVADLPDAVRAARGEGVHGTLTITSHECRRRSCTSTGDFVSDDGAVRRDDVSHVESRREWGVGGEVSVLLRGDEAYRDRYSYTWMLLVAWIAGSVVVLGMFVRNVRRRTTE